MSTSYNPASSGSVSLSITCLSSGSASRAFISSLRSSTSHAAFSTDLMFTSGSMIGIRPASIITPPTSNCWATIAAIPSAFALLITERIFVPKMPCVFASARRFVRPFISFISCTPLTSSCKPSSTLRNGTMFFFSDKYCAVGIPLISLFMVRSNKIAPEIRSSNFGLIMIRVRIS